MRPDMLCSIVLSSAVLLAAGCRPASKQNVDGGAAAPGVYDGVLADAACGQCQLGLPGDGCHLAVRLDGVAHFVDGTGIDDHGDAHADDGLCNAVRRARVSGEIVDGRFVATDFELLTDG